MESYEGYIEEDFLRAEVQFDIELPAYCEDQEFKLYEIIEEEEVQVINFVLILNARHAIVPAVDGIATYTGEIVLTDVETNVICQVKIDKDKVEYFQDRKFILKVL